MENSDNQPVYPFYRKLKNILVDRTYSRTLTLVLLFALVVMVPVIIFFAINENETGRKISSAANEILVKDTSGKPFPGATVIVRDVVTAQTISAVSESDINGEVTLAGQLEANRQYVILATAPSNSFTAIPQQNQFTFQGQQVTATVIPNYTATYAFTPPNGITAGQNLQVRVTSDTGPTTVEYVAIAVDGVPQWFTDGGQKMWESSSLSAGNHTFQFIGNCNYQDPNGITACATKPDRVLYNAIVYTVSPPPLPAPTNLQAQCQYLSGGFQINYSWSRVEGAASYRIEWNGNQYSASQQTNPNYAVGNMRPDDPIRSWSVRAVATDGRLGTIVGGTWNCPAPTATPTVTPVPPTASCTSYPAVVNVGQQVTWKASNQNGGNGSYTYSWMGTETGGAKSTGATSEFTIRYNTPGNKLMAMQISSGGVASGQIHCASATVNPATATNTPVPTIPPLSSLCPTLTWNGPQDVSVSQSFNVSITTSGGNEQYSTLLLDGNRIAPTGYNTWQIPPQAEGTHTLNYRIRDNKFYPNNGFPDGGADCQPQKTFKSIKYCPTISWNLPSTITTGQPFSFTLAPQGGSEQYTTVLFNGQKVEPSDYNTWTITPTQGGKNTLEYRVRDNTYYPGNGFGAGELCSTKTFTAAPVITATPTVTVAQAPTNTPVPPTASCTSYPAVVNVGQQVTWKASNQNGGNGSYTYSWMGTETGGAKSTGATSEFTIRYNTPGNKLMAMQISSGGVASGQIHCASATVNPATATNTPVPPSSTPIPTATPVPPTITPQCQRNSGGYNASCLGNQADYAFWRTEFIKTFSGASPDINADYNGDDAVNLKDFNLWRDRTYRLGQ